MRYGQGFQKSFSLMNRDSTRVMTKHFCGRQTEGPLALAMALPSEGARPFNGEIQQSAPPETEQRFAAWTKSQRKALSALGPGYPRKP